MPNGVLLSLALSCQCSWPLPEGKVMSGDWDGVAQLARCAATGWANVQPLRSALLCAKLLALAFAQQEGRDRPGGRAW